MRSRFGLRRLAGLTAFVAAAATVLVGAPGALGSGAAAYTTAIDDGSGNPAGCLNGQGINCNNYSSKSDVYVNGGPTNGAGLPEGTYYFAVLVPGYQHDGFIDGHKGNLSDITNGGTSGDSGGGDSYLCRELTVDGNGGVAYTPDAGCTTTTHAQGTDVQGNTVTQLTPYDDTSNGGGVYIVAICTVGATSSSQCKFDVFRIAAGNVPAVDDLYVSKLASPTFTRTYGWDSTKSRTSAGTVRQNGGSATISYSVTASWSGPTDSAWKVDGSITVTNPNDLDASSVNVTDVLSTNGPLPGGTADPNATCVVTGGTNATVLAHSAGEFAYSCTWGTGYAPADVNETNNAHVTWDNSGAFSSPDSSADADVPATFGGDTADGNPTVINGCVTLTDTFNGTPTTLGVACADGTFTKDAGNNLTNFPQSPAYNSTTHTFSFTYSRSIAVDPNRCQSYSNTVAITGITDSTPSDNSASVTVCPTVTGLTIGYWANKNGQSMIAKAGPSSGTCSLTTYLRNYLPFQELNASSTCSQVASYVLGVIKNATCASTSNTCNSMLKAQMLATALNVFFNKTNGSEVIDLVHGCKMIDSSTGTGTCNGSENWSPAFGGATSMTVSQMLAYAASQSNIGGSLWYGNVKATQVLAKDAFDAINNGVALSA